MKKAIRLRMILVSLITLILSSLISGVILQRNYKDNLKDESLTVLKAGALFVEQSTDYDAAAKALSAQYHGYRITVIAQDGEVLGDSSVDFQTMENHAARSEVKAASKRRVGYAERRSDSTGGRMLYAAYRTESGLILRSAVPNESVDEFFNRQIPAVLTGLFCAFISAFLMASKISAQAVRPIAQLSKEVKNIESGDYSMLIEPSRYEEMNVLISGINTMTESINLNMRTLRREKQKLDFLLDSIRQGIIVVDEKQNIVHLNHSAALLFEAVGCKAEGSILNFTQNMRILSALNTCMVTGESKIFELRNDRTGRIYSVSISTLSNDWMRNGAIIIMTDVTQASEAEQMRREFVANASHELKTPVTSIRGFAELLSSGLVTDPNQVKDYLERIKTESDRITNIIGDILRLSRLDEGTSVRQSEWVDLKKTAEETATELMPQAEARNIAITISGSGAVFAERDDIRELVNNLMDNAVKYNKESGSVFVSIDQEGSRVIFTVRDTGIGIPKRDIPRVFERFYRVDKGRSRRIGGTGLGLSIVKHVAAKYNAQIEVSSEMGDGTVIKVRF